MDTPIISKKTSTKYLKIHGYTYEYTYVDRILGHHSWLRHFQATVLAYGQTGSGKTYTMVTGLPSQEGALGSMKIGGYVVVNDG